MTSHSSYLPAEHSSPKRLHDLPTWLLGEATRLGWRLLGERLAAEGLTRNHYSVFSCLADQDGLAQADVGRATGIDESDLVRLLNSAEELGLVRRSRDPDNRRRNLVSLTPEGHTTLKRLDETVRQANEALLAPLSESERARFVESLRRVVSGVPPEPDPRDTDA
ncbi:MarR family winged helix-turn-helix transcriptional regulator [Streptomyces sp. NPDC087263]|uniref:MarR family winged helix-turn-helix transcriptional regulator n=1 Tax=Streptomyces sp. NPDC087263 TaxID=3365773 RepID=UPI00380787FC